jgi:chitodextrinase
MFAAAAARLRLLAPLVVLALFLVAVSGTNAATAREKVPPTVSLTSPAAGAVIGTVVITAAASDNVAVSGVRFYVDGVQVGQQDTSAPYSRSWNSGAVPAGTHVLTAVARDTSNNTAKSLPVSVVVGGSTGGTTSDTTAPSSPSGLATSSIGQTSLTLSWTGSTDNVGVTGYRLFKNGLQVGTSSSTSYGFAGLTCGSAYTLGVAAVDAAGNVSATAAVTSSTSACSDTTAPTAPSGLVTSGIAQTAVTLSWAASTDNVGVSGYRLFRNGSQVGTASSTSYVFAALACGTSYTFGVAAVDAAGNASSTAAVSASTSACPDTTAPSAPTGLSASATAQTSTTLSWAGASDNVGVTGYRVFLNGASVATAFTTSYVFGSLSCATSYTLGVAAVDAAGNVSGTASLSVTTSACSSGGTVVSPTLYVAQSQAGLGDGSSCANARPVSFFNTSANWGAGKPIAPGSVVGLCGTISSTLTAQGSGAAGAPITIAFTAGARVSQPACSPCLQLSGRSYLTVDGGSGGVVESTNNGTNLGLHQNSTGISATSCDNCELKNLTIQNIYVHAGSSAEIDQTQMRSIFASGSNLLIDHNVIHDAGWSVFIAMGNGNHDIHVDHNDIYNVDHGLITSSGTAGGSFGPIWFNNNHVHDFGNWDTSSNAYHHDGIHCYTVAGGQPMHISDYYIYDNRFDGSIGGNATSWIFMEAGDGSTSATPCSDATSNIWVFNNYGYTDHNLGNGVFGLFTGRNYVYNNTLVGNNTSATGQPQIVLAAGSAFSSGGALKNNILSTGNQVPSFGNTSFPATNRDYNTYANSGGNWYCNGFLSSYSAWQTCMGGDTHSSYYTSANLNPDGSPQTTSPTLNAGTNLTPLCNQNLTPLCQDINGNPRPTTGNWNQGYYH